MRHFIRYHKDERGNSITSFPGNFEAWANVRPTQPSWKPSVGVGDRVWLLSGKSAGAGRKSYSLLYSFVVAEPVQQVGDRFLLRGTIGAFINDVNSIERQPWFEEFFESIGRGGTGFQVIQPQFLDYFNALLSDAESLDRLDDAMATAPSDDESEEKRYLRSILARRGQPEFRAQLLKAYDGRCCVTSCEVQDVLEAAHIDPHSEGGGYSKSNGLLLRADIHILFDLYLLGLDDNYRVYVAKALRASEYGKLHGQRIRLPASLVDLPSAFGLKQRLEKIKVLEAGG